MWPLRACDEARWYNGWCPHHDPARTARREVTDHCFGRHLGPNGFMRLSPVFQEYGRGGCGQSKGVRSTNQDFPCVLCGMFLVLMLTIHVCAQPQLPQYIRSTFFFVFCDDNVHFTSRYPRSNGVDQSTRSSMCASAREDPSLSFTVVLSSFLVCFVLLLLCFWCCFCCFCRLLVSGSSTQSLVIPWWLLRRDFFSTALLTPPSFFVFLLVGFLFVFSF